jgi:hypothetical protein
MLLRVGDMDVALAGARGALLGLLQLIDSDPDPAEGRAVDQLAESLLCVFGLPPEEVREPAARTASGLRGPAVRRDPE